MYLKGNEMSMPGYANAAQPMLSQLQGLANQAFNQQYNQYQASQTQAALYNQILMQSQMARQQHRYMINGRTMSFDQWLDELAPGEDNPMRTFLILKYKE